MTLFTQNRHCAKWVIVGRHEERLLGMPCLTLRWNTERPVTLKEHGGVSVLVGNDVGQIRKAYHAALEVEHHSVRPELWDGQAAERCVQAIAAGRLFSEEVFSACIP